MYTPRASKNVAQLLRCLSFDDGRHPCRVGVLLAPGIRQHPREPVLDDDRPAGGLAKLSAKAKQIRWATPGFGFAAFQHQAVDDRGQLAPRHRRINHHHRDTLGRAGECGVIIVAATDQHHNRARRRRPAHRLFTERAPMPSSTSPTTVRSSTSSCRMTLRNSVDRGIGQNRNAHPVAAQHIDQPV